MKHNKAKLLSSFLAAVMAVVVIAPLPDTANTTITEKPVVIAQQLHADAASGRAYNQYYSRWKSKQYTKWGSSGNTLRSSGCMLFSFANAIYSLNGIIVNIPEIADWSCDNGSWKPGAGGGYRDAFYNQVEAAFGSKYHFTLNGKYWNSIEDSRLIKHLQNGGVATAHVYNHFIAIVGYNAENKTYHVIESAVARNRGMTPDSWVSAEKLKSGDTKVDWFCLISKKNTTVQTTGTSEPAASPETQETSPDSANYFPQYNGTSGSVVKALDAIGTDSTYYYLTKIAYSNGIPRYSGSSVQNRILLSKLKAGKLIRPDSGKYFAKYTGDSESIAAALRAIGEDGSYEYREKIASVNGIYNYTGTAAQNITMLNKLKIGTLIKP